MANETWKSIPGYERYRVSNHARIRSDWVRNKNTDRLRYPPKILKQQKSRDGYFQVDLSKNGVVKKFGVHALMLMAFVGLKPTTKHQARHLNGNPGDNDIHNLAWGTQRENENDKTLHRTRAMGEKQGNAKLSNSQVKEILINTDGLTQVQLAKKYSVSRWTVRGILNGTSWAHLAADAEIEHDQL